MITSDSFVYHLKPNPLIGNKLVPLNDMDQSSDLFQKNIQKYFHRKALLDVKIPILDCRWNDVIHFSALSPQVIYEQLLRINPDQQLQRTHYYKISVRKLLLSRRAVIFNANPLKAYGDYTIDPTEVTSLNPNSNVEIFDVPTATLRYWEHVKQNGGLFLWFPYVPHILVKGEIDVSECEEVAFQ